MCYHITADFQGTNIFIVGFSLSKVLFKASKLKFLDGLVYGIYIASVETTDEEVNSDLVVKSAELDNKEFIPRSASIAQLRQSFESPKSGHSDEFESNEESVGLSLENQSPRGSSQAQTIKSLNQSPIDSFSFPLNKLSILIPASDTMTIDNFKDIKHIADGSNSNICLAKYNNSLVIIKMIKTEAQNDAVAIHEFDIEYSLLTRLSHPNIIKVIGCGKSPRKFIVLEYLKGGTLNTILSYNQAKPGLANKLFRKPTYTYAVLLSKVQDMAEAFQYLHGEVNSGAMIIHRGMEYYLIHILAQLLIFFLIDLKPDNVGFAEDGSLKLFDFGLCTCVRRRNLLNEAYEMTGNTGSLRYMAPEVALRKPYTEKVDVYSFGILVWQMARDRIPFKGLGRDEFMKSVVKGGLRPEVDQTWPAGFQELLQSCWHTDPQARPSFSQIVQQLTMLRDDLTGKSLKKGRSVFGGMKGNSLKMNDDIGSTSLSSDTSNNSNSNRPPQSSWF